MLVNLRLILFVLSIFFSLSFSSSANTKPNVILIMTDDQGYGDLSIHGNPILKTPNLDKLARESVRFNDFHVDPTCAPTRAALLTGKYAHRVGVWHTIAGGNHMRANETTMADVFKLNGYNTALFGKWHLGANYPYRPMDRGFDEWLGQGDGGTGTTDDWFDNDRMDDYYWHNGQRVKREGFTTDVFFNSAISYIQHSRQQQKPFFIYLSTYLPHHPHVVPDKAWLKPYRGKVSSYEAHFFAGIDNIDANVGRLRKTLHELNLVEDTIIIFMTDNGGTGGVKVFNAGMRGAKTSVYEGGHRVPFFIRWPKGGLEHGKQVEDLNAHIDILPTLIDLLELKTTQPIDFDGRSFKPQLFNTDEVLSERTLFVENQRTFTAKPWHQTAGMYRQWRFVNNQELYKITNDSNQRNNIALHHPEMVAHFRNAFKAYWQRVSQNDRAPALSIIGHPDDPETFLHPSDWHLPDVPWNHAQVAEGAPHAGTWYVHMHQAGRYRFEVRRWPREADAMIQGIPKFNKKVDAWDLHGSVKRMVYGFDVKALPVDSISLQVNGESKQHKVNKHDKALIFEFDVSAGETQIKGLMLDSEQEVIAGTYYVYVSKV